MGNSKSQQRKTRFFYEQLPEKEKQEFIRQSEEFIQYAQENPTEN